MQFQIERIRSCRWAGRLSINATLPRGVAKARHVITPKQRKTVISQSSIEEEDIFDTSPYEEEEEEEEVIELTEEERQLIELDSDEGAGVSAEMGSLLEETSDQFLLGELSEEDVILSYQDLDPYYADRKPFVDQEELRQTFEFGKAMAAVADEMKCQSVRLLDVHKKVDWAFAFLIITAMSRTQMRAVLGKMEKVARDQWGIDVVEAVTRRSEWECIDFGDLVVHVFSPRTRVYYNLDDIYQKCEEIEVPIIPSPSGEAPQWQRSLKSEPMM